MQSRTSGGKCSGSRHLVTLLESYNNCVDLPGLNIPELSASDWLFFFFTVGYLLANFLIASSAFRPHSSFQLCIQASFLIPALHSGLIPHSSSAFRPHSSFQLCIQASFLIPTLHSGLIPQTLSVNCTYWT